MLFGCRTNSEDVPLERVLRYTVPRRPAVPSAGALALPSSYVAHTDVVLLDGDDAGAPHVPVAVSKRIHTIERELPAGRRADALTTVIARASACVGSPSGLAYIASLCGVKSMTLYSDRRHWRYRAELVDSLRSGIGAAA